ncbi:helix-turn-helix transcriptional regulator [Trinickia sp. LjRoot230]|uniref:helix-turn-helix transcriptional regulator n=1 Tax=Trinickia sp. LjRoot230 TaxID=3342288 RepID=UPI003ECCC96E
MFWAVYLPLISTMVTDDGGCGISALVREGNIREAAARACTLAEQAQGSDRIAVLALNGDLHLAIGANEEAEESLRKSQSLVKGTIGQVRLHASRNGAWQALSRGRISTALKCFSSILADDAVAPERRLESLAGECFALHQLGYFDDAIRKLDEMNALSVTMPDASWLRLAQAIRADLTLQAEIRRSPQLGDHIFWTAATFLSRGWQWDGDATIDGLAPLVAKRLHYLQQVRALSEGDALSIGNIKRYLDWSATALPGHQRFFKVEAALAALASGQTSFADALLDARRAKGDHLGSSSAPGRWEFEYLYCLAKLHKQLGRAHESMLQFEQYALCAMQCIRVEVLPAAQHSSVASADGSNVLDDIGVLLPPRYRRAYAYMLDNLGNPNLSVREIAAHIGVTQRSLQIAFKAYVGVSPKDVLQKKRLDRIDSELSADQRTNLSILEVARKWGVPNRSKLANWYRRQHRGKPSDVLTV